MSTSLKSRVHDFWNAESCGESYAASENGFDLSIQERERYALEPYLLKFARFADGAGRDVVEIGVGMGADHLMWARARPRSLAGIDLTERGVSFTHRRIAEEGFVSDLRVGDAEATPFPPESFDLLYSWGVMHHSPNTPACFAEAYRVLRPGGRARIMIYHTQSLVGLMLWLRYGLLAGRPNRRMAEIYAEHLESPGTKAYSPGEAVQMLRDAGFSEVSCRVQLSHGDLLKGNVGSRHSGPLLAAAKSLWPRWLLERVAGGFGLYLLLEARK